jgi:acetolactate synthase-1/2/3 large subunit
VVCLPEDVDRDKTPSKAPRMPALFDAAPSQEGIDAAAALLGKAERPCIVAGGGVTRNAATADLVRLAERLGAPVFTGWRRFDAFPNNHPLYLGPLPVTPPELMTGLTEADVILAIGTRLGEFTTRMYSWPAAGQKLVQIDRSAEDTGGGFAGADVAIVSEVGPALRALGGALGDVDASARERRLKELRDAYVRRTTPRAAKAPDGLSFAGIYHDILRMLPDTASVSSDAGTFGGWLMRFYRWNHPRTFFAPTAGGMGYALPGAIGAKLARPDEPAVAFAGDGGFAMTMSEIETATRLKLRNFLVLVFNNSNYGTITGHQKRQFPGRFVATELGFIDFAKTAESMGALGFTVRSNGAFTKTFGQGLAADRPAVINIVYDADKLNPWADE